MLGEEPDVKEQLFEVLKQYAAERDVEALAEALPDILITEEHQQLIDSVRYSISRSDSDTNRSRWSLFAVLAIKVFLYIWLRHLSLPVMQRGRFINVSAAEPVYPCFSEGVQYVSVSGILAPSLVALCTFIIKRDVCLKVR